LLKTFQGTLSVFKEVLDLRTDAESAPDRLVFANGTATAA